MQTMFHASIGGIRGYLPERVLTNEELSQEIGWTPADIARKTGIVSRRIAAADECVSDMATLAAKRLIIDLRLDPEALDFLILCTQTPDHYLPTTACLVQCRLGLPSRCASFDLNQGCSGYIYSLSVATAYIRSGMFRQGIVLTADTYSKLIHPKDRSVRTLFGDAATATWIRRSDEPGLGRFVMGTDGSGAENLIVPAGGLRQRSSQKSSREFQDESGNTRSADHLSMNGPTLFEFALRRVPDLANRVLESNDLGGDCQPHWYVFHQASGFMLEQLRSKMSIPREKVVYHLREVGNTVSSTIPLALREYEQLGRFSVGEKLLLLGFGVGYSWGGTILTWR